MEAAKPPRKRRQPRLADRRAAMFKRKTAPARDSERGPSDSGRAARPPCERRYENRPKENWRWLSAQPRPVTRVTASSPAPPHSGQNAHLGARPRFRHCGARAAQSASGPQHVWSGVLHRRHSGQDLERRGQQKAPRRRTPRTERCHPIRQRTQSSVSWDRPSVHSSQQFVMARRHHNDASDPHNPGHRPRS